MTERVKGSRHFIDSSSNCLLDQASRDLLQYYSLSLFVLHFAGRGDKVHMADHYYKLRKVDEETISGGKRGISCHDNPLVGLDDVLSMLVNFPSASWR